VLVKGETAGPAAQRTVELLQRHLPPQRQGATS
jgi:hypothetical protein